MNSDTDPDDDSIYDEDVPYELVGRLMVSFSEMDWWTHILAWELIGNTFISSVGPAVTDTMGIEQLTRMLERLSAVTRDEDYVSERMRLKIRAFARSVDQATKDRNAVAHALWRRQKGTPSAVRIWHEARSMYQDFVPSGVPASDIARITAACESITDRAHELITELWEEHDGRKRAEQA